MITAAALIRIYILEIRDTQSFDFALCVSLLILALTLVVMLLAWKRQR